MFSCDGDGGLWGYNFQKEYEKVSGRVWNWRSDYHAVRTDPDAIEMVKRLSVEGPLTGRCNNERAHNVGIAWIPRDLFEYVVLDEDDKSGTEYVNLGTEKMLDQLLKVDPNDSKQVERLQAIGKRIVAQDIKYEYYYIHSGVTRQTFEISRCPIKTPASTPA
jgi:hypothetical protein